MHDLSSLKRHHILNAVSETGMLFLLFQVIRIESQQLSVLCCRISNKYFLLIPVGLQFFYFLYHIRLLLHKIYQCLL